MLLRGRVASLLEVGTGFHPELTGRENIFLNGAILGMTQREIRRKFDEIVAFAEVGGTDAKGAAAQLRAYCSDRSDCRGCVCLCVSETQNGELRSAVGSNGFDAAHHPGRGPHIRREWRTQVRRSD